MHSELQRLHVEILRLSGFLNSAGRKGAFLSDPNTQSGFRSFGTHNFGSTLYFDETYGLFFVVVDGDGEINTQDSFI